MPRHTPHSTISEPQSRSAAQARKAAQKFADGLRALDTADDFSIMQQRQEVVVMRNARPKERSAIRDVFALVARQVTKDGALEDVHMHYDGSSLLLIFTVTDVMPV